MSEAAGLAKLVELYVRTCEIAANNNRKEALFAITALDPARLSLDQFAHLFDMSKVTPDQLGHLFSTVEDHFITEKDIENLGKDSLDKTNADPGSAQGDNHQ